MKKFIVAFSLLLVSATAFCQTTKHSWMIGGSGMYSSTKEGNINNSIIDFSPRVGFFIIDKLAVGLNATYNVTKDDGEDFTTTSFGPYLRYYFLNAGEKVKLFANANAVIGNEDEGLGASSLSGYGAAIGANYFFNEHVALEGSFGYNSTKAKIEDVKDNEMAFKLGFQIFFGK